MKGYGSNGFQIIKAEFTAIHRNSIPPKMLIKRQLPPKSASLSAIRSPKLRCWSYSILMFLDKSSCSVRLLTTCSSKAESSPLSVLITSWTYSVLKRFRSEIQIKPCEDQSGCVAFILSTIGSRIISADSISLISFCSLQI